MKKTIDKYNPHKCPVINPVDQNVIPKKLKKMKTWVLWKWEWTGKKWTKPPCNEFGDIVSHTKSKLTFKKAYAAHLNSKGELGIGVSMRKTDDICGIDLDGVLKKNGAVKNKVKAALKKSKLGELYTEVSPSGKGLRIFGISKGDVKTFGARSSCPVEIYTTGRYLTVTGNIYTNGNNKAGTISVIKGKQASKLISLLNRAGAGSGSGGSGSGGSGSGFDRPGVDYSNPETLVGYQKLIKLMDGLSGMGYDDWLEIGMALHKECNAANYGLLAWTNWSKSFENFESEEDCAKRWAGFGNYMGKMKGIGSIIKRHQRVLGGLLSGDDDLDMYFDDADVAVEEFNKFFAIGDVGGKVYIIAFPRFGEEVRFYTVYDFKTRYANRFAAGIGKDGKEGLVTEWWLKNSLRNECRNIIFDPAISPGYNKITRDFNLWQGFAIDAVKGDWSLMKHHIYWIICRGNEEYYDYLLMWMANIVQNPGGERPGVCVSLAGDKGTGKGTLADWFGRIFGIHYIHCIKSEQLVGKFNSHLANSVFCFADEAVFPGNKNIEGQLKGLITERELLFERKFMNPFSVRSHINIMMASNEDWIFPASKSERRFFALELSEERKQDIAYFKDIHQQMSGKGGKSAGGVGGGTGGGTGLEAMLYELLYEIKVDIAVLYDPPYTRPLRKQIEFAEDSVTRFWREVKADHTIIETSPGIVGMKVRKHMVYRAYLSFCDDMKIDQYGRFSAVHFGRLTNRLMKGFNKRVYKGASDSLYIVFERLWKMLDTI